MTTRWRKSAQRRVDAVRAFHGALKATRFTFLIDVVDSAGYVDTASGYAIGCIKGKRSTSAVSGAQPLPRLCARLFDALKITRVREVIVSARFASGPPPVYSRSAKTARNRGCRSRESPVVSAGITM